MERLTERNKYKAAYYPYCFKENTCDGKGTSKKCDYCEFSTMVCERLAEYEDTGLTPEQILAMDEEYTKLAKELGEYKRLEEQGRLIKLPCKIGDLIYRINKGARYPVIALVVTEIRYKALRNGTVAIKLMCSDDVMTKTNGCSVYYLEEIEKKIWLTKAEAEKALAEMGCE